MEGLRSYLKTQNVSAFKQSAASFSINKKINQRKEQTEKLFSFSYSLFFRESPTKTHHLYCCSFLGYIYRKK